VAADEKRGCVKFSTPEQIAAQELVTWLKPQLKVLITAFNSRMEQQEVDNYGSVNPLRSMMDADSIETTAFSMLMLFAGRILHDDHENGPTHLRNIIELLDDYGHYEYISKQTLARLPVDTIRH
jgi:hypothetical protein